ncbi:MAG TPA: hypothetical protein VGU71_14850 [Candidatus Dormibacteraeota bacterium]|nr:hypothetical protein [Candidatus Dormibacteraeota bacterium]
MSALTLNRGWLTLLVVLGLFGLGVARSSGLWSSAFATDANQKPGRRA